MARMGQTTSAPTETGTDGADRAVVRRLVLGSALMLFLELALIRWLGSNIVHLSYFSNFVLLGSFLGIGIGFLVSRRSWTLVPVAPLLLALLVVGVRLFPVSLDRTGSGVIYFTSLQATGPPAWLVLPVVFVVVALVIAGPAEIVGRCFADLTPLTAYRWDLIGSLIGIGGFTVLSFLWAPPVVWGAIVAVAFVLLVPNLRRLVALLSGAAVVVTLLIESIAPGTSWSPYYKVTTEDIQGNRSFVRISVNGIPHQMMAPAQWKLEQGEQQYTTPYQRIKDNPLDNVLIVGAGSGSDVAIALAKGAKHIDAVDIDPRIMQIGVERNPDRAYQDPRVTRHVNDGRAFLQSTDTKYDLILFALPDSLTLVSGASQIRLESFLFTDTALTEAREHLKPDGAFAMYNYYREVWLIDRLAGTAAGVFGHTPCVDTFAAAQAVVTVARDADFQQCETAYQPAGEVIAPATDDRPFLYFNGDGFPSMYLWAIACILFVSALALRLLGGPFRSMRPYADLFFMGAAFLLLETKNVATFALLFGTTWLVNALVFAGVLVVVLAAVETTRRVRTPPLPVVFVGIAASLAVAYAVQPELAAVAAVRAPPGRRRAAGLPADLPGQHRLRQTVQRVRPTRAPRSRSTSWARSWAAASSTPPCSPATPTCCCVVAGLYLLAFLLTPEGGPCVGTVAVLGGGLQGCCIALELASRGRRRHPGRRERRPAHPDGRRQRGQGAPRLHVRRRPVAADRAHHDDRRAGVRAVPAPAPRARTSPLATSSPAAYVVHRDSQRAADEVAGLPRRPCTTSSPRPPRRPERPTSGGDVADAGAPVARRRGGRRLRPGRRPSLPSTAPRWPSTRWRWPPCCVADRRRAAHRGAHRSPGRVRQARRRRPLRGRRDRPTATSGQETFDQVVNALWGGRIAVDETPGSASRPALAAPAQVRRERAVARLAAAAAERDRHLRAVR